MRDPAYISPLTLAKRWNVSPTKILQWIRAGELLAFNLTQRPSGRARYKIAEADVDLFLERRRVQPPATKSRRRRKRREDVTPYF